MSIQYWRVKSLASAVAVAIVLGLTGSAAADSGSTTDDNVTAQDVVTALANIQSRDGDVSPAVATTSDTDSAAIAKDSDGTTVDIPKDPSTGVAITSASGEAVKISLPSSDIANDAVKLSDGAVAYPSNTGAANVVIPADGGAQILTTIANEEADETYEYHVTLPPGGSISLDADTGGATILDANGQFVAAVAKPFAHDSAGNDVPTHFEIINNKLVQVVKHKSTSFSYPIVADPWFGFRLIDHVSWSNGTLQVYPTWMGRWGAGYLARWSAWSEVVSKAPSSNRQNMADQFYCHWDLVRLRAPNKPSWNLDSWRPSVGYWATLRTNCNP